MNVNTQGGINLRVIHSDCLYECGDAIPAICPVCNNQIDPQKYIINHSICAYRCIGCSRLLVLYNDWLFMPNREFYKVEHDINAVRKRQDSIDEKRIDNKVNQVEKLLSSSKRQLERADNKKREEKIKAQRDLEKAMRKRNGEPLGKMPKQRKRSVLS